MEQLKNEFLDNPNMTKDQLVSRTVCLFEMGSVTLRLYQLQKILGHIH